MLFFLLGIAILTAGYFIYGGIVEKVVGPDSRITPAIRLADGVDFVVLPAWKNMMIHLLNIAGIGPVVGAIIGIQFGEITFLIIPIGCVFAGAVHDFLSGMMSLRDNGANLPKIIEDNLGKKFSVIFSWFMVFMLLVVVAVLINIPAALCNKLVLPENNSFWPFVGLIFLYYIVATLFPVDKIIGKIYPVFGILLLIGTIGLFIILLKEAFADPRILTESAGFKAHKFTPENNRPIIPLLFVTIACGILSGGHATQSPIVARTMKSEKEARPTFFAMMIAEGFIAMVWAAVAMIVYNDAPELMGKNVQNVVLPKITALLGNGLDIITMTVIVILAVTSGDTVMRSLRLSISEMLHIPQKPLLPRILTCLPLIAIVVFLLWWSNLAAKSFGYLWNYFAWSNQVIAACTLLAASVWLFQRGKRMEIALVPGLFITFIVSTYICWTNIKFGPPGLGLPLNYASVAGAALTVLTFIYVRHRCRILPPIHDDSENSENK